MTGLAAASVILLLVSILGIASNLIALLTVVRTKYLQNTFGALCVSLSSSNLGICLIFFGWCSLKTLSCVFHFQQTNNRQICFSSLHSHKTVVFDSELGKTVGQVALLFLYGSVYTHLAVSFNRMMSLMYPLKYLMMFDFQKGVALLIIVWTCAVIETVPYFWSAHCFFFYKSEVALWEFAETKCGEFFGFYFDFLLSVIIVLLILTMDIIALSKLRKNNADIHSAQMSHEQRRRRKLEVLFFVQSLCQTVPFLLAVLCFHVVSRYATTDKVYWQLFFAMTFSWVSLHAVDGIIFNVFHTRRAVFGRSNSTRYPQSFSIEPPFVILLATWSSIDRFHLPIFIFIFLIEIMAQICLFVIAVHFQPILHKSRKFHFNMMRIGCFFHLHVFVLLGCRGIILLYQFQFVPVGDARSFTQITLQIVTIIRVYEIYAASFCFFGLVVERTFATIFISDYEVHTIFFCKFTKTSKHSQKGKRRYISICIIIAIITICSANALQRIRDFYHFWGAFLRNPSIPRVSVVISQRIVLLYSTIASLLSLPLSISITRKNLSHQTRSEKGTAYPLSSKFQIAENFRAFKILRFRVLRHITIVASIFNIPSAIAVALAVLPNENASVSSLYGQLFETLHTLGLLVAVVVLLRSQPSWRYKSSRSRVAVKRRTSIAISNASQVTNAYFGELAKAWDLCISPVEVFLNRHRPLYLFLFSAEALTQFLLVAVASKFQPILRKSSKYHCNMMRIASFFNCQAYVLFGCRAALCFFQFDLVQFSDTQTLSYAILLGVSIVRIYEIYIGSFCFFGFVIERGFATIFISDYESRNRRGISICIILTIFAVCIGNAVVSTYGAPCFNVVSAQRLVLQYTMVLYASMFTIALLIYRINWMYQANIEKYPFYALSSRFQIAENFRAFRVLRDITLVASISSVVGAYASAVAIRDKTTWRDRVATSLGLQQW
ncbi:hypothetical protein PRIPAC_81778 [Pristionchus pacificus]|uniref:G protein-coupled receptor n=1 Tax=Pristionchus pacificus TaxID=54126 RepID=A0A2A6CLW2_PRIPA|nr:hypothetical protein PRIPAC_81778 [Pristionchus pacificus]|eukprot:PDM79106.1 G protein-coupled receptor [Pristionchus pacificus]